MVVFEAATNSRRAEMDRLAWLAHTTAKLGAYAPQKSSDFPKLERMLSSHTVRPKSAPDWRVDLARVKAWVNST